MTDSDCKFAPGAARFGDFINYYEFNSPENRLKVLPKDLLVKLEIDSSKSVLALDVGCNVGDMTTSLYNLFTETSRHEPEFSIHILGVDINPVLITRANEKNTNPGQICFSTLDIMSDDSKDYLTDFLSKFKKKYFDVTFCLSISMWIHLNYGDDGLQKLLRSLSGITRYFIIEPQPWKCYRTAVRRASRLNQERFQHFSTLKIRANVIEYITDFLEKHCDMVQLECCGKTAWDRPMIIYRNTRV